MKIILIKMLTTLIFVFWGVACISHPDFDSAWATLRQMKAVLHPIKHDHDSLLADCAHKASPEELTPDDVRQYLDKMYGVLGVMEQHDRDNPKNDGTVLSFGRWREKTELDDMSRRYAELYDKLSLFPVRTNGFGPTHPCHPLMLGLIQFDDCWRADKPISFIQAWMSIEAAMNVTENNKELAMIQFNNWVDQESLVKH